MIHFSDLSLQHKAIKKDMRLAMAKVIQRNDYILGEDVQAFEKEFAQFCNTQYAVGVSSGTAALFLANMALGIGQNDEVILPAFTYIATALAVSYTGAKPVFVDIEEDTYNIDVKKIESAITKNTKAIIPVHLYGQPANMSEVLRIAKKHNLKVIEDSAQAHGATLKMFDGKSHVTGGIGDIGAFSFYPSKNLGALGDGGMLITDNEEAYKKILMLRDYGRVSKYEHSMIGYNSRLDTLQAAILRIKLKKLNSWNEMRRKAADMYNKLLKGTDGIITPFACESVKHIYHVYAIRSQKRDEIFNHLKNNGVGVIIHYPIPLHLQKAYADLGYKKGDFPVSERVAQEIISLPMYPYMKEKDIKFVVKLIKEVVNK
jgi:dTDP-4-amino-4,6-dideoxygalactose transaminase